MGTLATLILLLVFWLVHAKVQPFCHRFQNRMESCVYASNLLLLCLAAFNPTVQDADWDGEKAVVLERVRARFAGRRARNTRATGTANENEVARRIAGLRGTRAT